MSKDRFSILALMSFFVAILLLSISIKYINMGIAFAIWSGLSIVFNNLFNILIYKEEFSFPKLRGIIYLVCRLLLEKKKKLSYNDVLYFRVCLEVWCPLNEITEYSEDYQQ